MKSSCYISYFLSQSRNSLYFYNPKIITMLTKKASQFSLFWARTTQCTFSKPLLHTLFNLSLPSMPRSFKLSLSLMYPHQNLLSSPPMCYVQRPSHYSRFYHADNLGWRVQVMRFLNSQLPRVPLARPSQTQISSSAP